MRRYIVLAVLTGLLSASSIHLGAEEAISISATPMVTFARGYAQLKVRVERNDLNRTLIWEVDGPNYYRSSTMELDGASAPKSWFFLLRELPEGEYDIRAIVRRSDNSQSFAATRIRVLPGLH